LAQLKEEAPQGPGDTEQSAPARLVAIAQINDRCEPKPAGQ
jgi:hypothetical protein